MKGKLIAHASSRSITYTAPTNKQEEDQERLDEASNGVAHSLTNRPRGVLLLLLLLLFLPLAQLTSCGGAHN